MNRALVAALEQPAADARVQEVVVGLVYTAVLLDDGRAGVAYTFRDQAEGACAVFRGLRPLAGRGADELLPLAASLDPIEAAVGLATANALISPGPDGDGGDVLEHLELRQDDDVGMVGHFGPLVPEVRRRSEKLYIFERLEKPVGNMLPQEQAPQILPQCQVAIISATTLINHSLEGLLDVCSGCRVAVLLGPSTPLLPGVFQDTPLTMISGMVVRDAPGLMKVVAQAGGTRQFSRLVDKRNVSLTG